MNDFNKMANGIQLDQRSIYLRQLVLRTLRGGGRGHIGSTLSLIEIIRVLYDDIMNFNPQNPDWEQRDRFILSKGHGCIAQYVVLADKGFINLEDLDTFCKFDSILGGHPDANKIPGVEASTGSLGHGLSIGFGIALAAKIKNEKNHVYVVVGDGEINEGSIWEAALSIGKHQLNNLTVIIDYNKIQSAGRTEEIQNLEPLSDKWRSFNFSTYEVNGHDIQALKELLLHTRNNENKPVAIICHTIKGKGIKFAENDPTWHHKARLTDEILAKMNDALEN